MAKERDQGLEPIQEISNTKPPEPLMTKRPKRIAKLKQPAKTATNTVTDNRLELLITTVNRSKAEFYIDLLQSFDINMQFVSLGYGTANAKMMSMFGLTNNEKAVIFSVIQGNKIPAVISTLEEKFKTIRDGNGIAYTVPFSGIIGALIFGFLSDNRNMVINK